MKAAPRVLSTDPAAIRVCSEGELLLDLWDFPGENSGSSVKYVHWQDARGSEKKWRQGKSLWLGCATKTWNVPGILESPSGTDIVSVFQASKPNGWHGLRDRYGQGADPID
ncbi:hypothetical protein JR316_0006938 [Psilocybe cubensis]|uniref:Uncharacterized protein n=1 Tax=Psilocybe cubensis TaxID=181762 RepID=A0ACB8GX66_PSICU|nr:hypothetical protein JR316_0006938 [Psilocybe cubensis]KAH9480340.1 hypothetical protein JR316_0006938 [Psilocybe cubensis]